MNIITENIVGIWLVPVTVFIILPLVMYAVFIAIKAFQLIVLRQQLKKIQESKNMEKEAIELTRTVQS
jgi:hypothetical protein